MRILKNLFPFLLLALLPFRGLAQEVLRPAAWPAGATWASGAPLPSKCSFWQSDAQTLEAILANAPDRFPVGAPGALIELPLGPGERRFFRVFRDPLLHPELAAKFPEIRIHAGHAADDPAVRLRLETGPRGLHLQILEPGKSALYLDPLDPTDPGSPLVLYRRADYDASLKPPFRCHTEGKEAAPEAEESRGVSGINGELRVYRLALACTGEYTVAVGATTKAQALAAMTTSMNRVNGIYERDLGVRMELVAGNDQLVFFIASTDPYTNNDVFAMLDENQQTCDNLIGNAGYDVGHVFGTGGGGVAGLGTPCETGYKANGVTGLSNPKGDGFDIDYVAHEMGHQFGCNHTFNNSCSGNRNGPTAWEPGSGSTIMGYAGICDPNIQSFSDAFFHGGSMQEAFSYAVAGPGNTCAVKLTTGNQAPSVNAGPDRIIPRSTPFELEAQATDPEGDSLTYCWEQFENAIATMPPSASAAAGPLFRSFSPNPSPVRVFPNMTAILANQSPTWEVLPAKARNLDFRVTVRDNHPAGGNWEQDAVRLTVNELAGPFIVTQPNSPLQWVVGDTVTVAWNPAGTAAAPVSCSAVDIRLSTDGGLTWPHLLVAGVPNDGAHSLVAPLLIPSTKCRVKVKASGNVFFDVSNTNFSIALPATPSFLASGLEDSLRYCTAGDDTLNLSVALQSLSGFSGPLTLTLLAPTGLGSDLPDTFDLQGKDTLNYRVWGLSALPPGEERFSLQLAMPNRTRVLDYTLFPENLLMEDAVALFPADGADSIGTNPVLRWTAVPGASEYLLELATSPAFGATILLQQVVRDTFLAVDLPPFSTGYWRVSPANACGPRPPRAVWAFRTVQEQCTEHSPENLPIVIPEGQTFLQNSVVAVTGTGRVSKIRVAVDLQHQRLQDITLRLLSPAGSARSVFAKNCPDGQDIQATFRDDGNTFLCASLPPAISGDVLPATGSFTHMLGQPATGNWALRIVDDNNLTGGVLQSWTLTLCRFPPLPPAPALLALDTLDAGLCLATVLTPSELAVEDDPTGTAGFVLRQSPQSGLLERNGQPLVPGDTLWMADVLAGTIAYRHVGDTATTDELLLDAFDSATGGWLPGLRLPVRIDGALALEARIDAALVCHGDSSGAILLQFSGCSEPLAYRLLPDGPWQSEPLFSGLPAGNYSFEARDGLGRMAESATLTLVEPLPLTSAWLLQGDTLIASAMGGLPPFRYTLGQDTVSDGRLPVPASGNYVLTVIDSLGCSLSTPLDLQLLAGGASYQGPACHGGADGSILLQASGGTAPYSYRLDGGAWQADPVFSGLSAGIYIPAVRDAIEAVRILNPVDLIDPEPLVLDAQQTGDSAVLLSASGGTAPYLWQREGGVPQDSAFFEGLAPGEWTFFVTDSRGCRDSIDVLLENSSTVDSGKGIGKILVRPNPNDGLFRVSLPGTGGVPLTWTLRDAAGREAIGGAVLGEVWEVNATVLPSGMYFLEVRSPSGSWAVPVRIR